jgi:hypothetical protein
MPLQKLLLKPGVNRENTRYTNEGGWYESDKVRFRQGTPEKIGGWQRISANTFLGVCRSLWNWVTLAGQNLLGIGTSVKFYIENGGAYYDITPIRTENTLTNPFTTDTTTNSGGYTTVTVTATPGFANGDYVTFYPTVSSLASVVITGTAGQFSCTATTLVVGQAITITGTLAGTGSITGYTSPTNYYIIATNGTTTFTLSATYSGTAITTTAGTPTGLTYSLIPTVGGVSIFGEYQLTYLSSSTYTIRVLGTASSSTTGGGTVYAVYQVTTGSVTYIPSDGWGAGTWGGGAWGVGSVVPVADAGIRIWNQLNWGQNLVYGPRGFPLYYWDATVGYQNTEISMTIASPCVVTCSLGLADGTPITLSTTGALPTGLLPGTTYYVKYLSSSTFNLATSATASGTLSGVAITGTAGQFSCTASSIPLAVGQSLTISGTYGGTGSITGYTNPTKYYIIAVNSTSTTFTLSTTAGGSGVTTTAGTPTGLTYTLSTTINTSGTQTGTPYISPRGVLLSSLAGSDGYAPLYQNTFTVSDASRFLIVFGTNDYGSTVLDPMLIRWSDQESLTTWYPSITNQAGSARLSHGSEIVTTLQSRQEILVWTDSSLYSLQYLGPPYVWSSQILADNVSIIGPNAAVMASGVSYWMGVDKFYKYDGRVQTLRCDLRQYIYSDINLQESGQVFGSTNEGFNEAWFFYCSSNSSAIDRYVIYNYTEDIWQYGTMARTAWLDTGLRNYPIAATYSYNIVQHEYGVDNNETAATLPIEASITSSQYDIGDGHNFAFVYRMIPDLTFRGSTGGTTPAVTMYLQGLNNSGSGITQSGNAGVTYNGTAPSVINVDEYTGQVYIRIRGRQMQMKITSNTIGTQWQLGAPRIDMRPDGRR